MAHTINIGSTLGHFYKLTRNALVVVAEQAHVLNEGAMLLS